jgi:class 3 adenylate cyclase/tetratricopeptide (TPR) repeat protein
MSTETPSSPERHGHSEADAIRRMLADGLTAMALDRVHQVTHDEGERATPDILFLGALASVRMGAGSEAQAWLDRIDTHRIDDVALAVDVWALAGRIAKDRYASLRSISVDEANTHAAMALEHYRHAFELSGRYYPAINAATMAFLLGRSDDSRRLARRALDACDEQAEENHWWHASRGEALLLLGRVDEAAAAYERARVLAGHRFGDIASMRRQLLLIGSPSAHSLLDRLPAPRVIAFTGHMIDAPGRANPRFPENLEGAVADALRERIARIGPSIGFSQAACGADILFLEAMQAAGMQTHVVLPCATRDYLASSVAFAGPSWVARFEQVVARATSKLLATDEPLLGDDVLFEHASNLIHGMALLRAAELETKPLLVGVLDASGLRHEGGTAATVDAWTRARHEVHIVDLAALRGSARDARGDAMQKASPGGGRRIQSLLFADIKGFSRLPEQYTPRFADLFLGLCKRLLDGLERKAVDANTRGDGIFVVFDRPADAARFAISLKRELASVDWASLGLPMDTGARIGLHTGPVFKTYDPVMGKPTFYGTHVNLTARLEPVVQVGHIFATEAFAASLRAEGDETFPCHYIGELPLAKRFGDARLYRLTAGAGDLIKSAAQ